MFWLKKTIAIPKDSPVVDVAEHVTPHFRWGEFFVSSERPDLARELPLVIPIKCVYGLYWLSQSILEPVRLHFNRSMVISSGFRSEELNGYVKGVHNSQHLYGEAADFGVMNTSYREVFDFIGTNMKHNIGVVKLYPTWIHVSLPTNEKRGIVIDNG